MNTTATSIRLNGITLELKQKAGVCSLRCEIKETRHASMYVSYAFA